MKKILLGAFIALATLVTSCGSKDNDTPTPPQKSPEIIGVWQMESSTIDGKPISVSECTIKETVVFTEKTIELLSFKKRIPLQPKMALPLLPLLRVNLG